MTRLIALLVALVVTTPAVSAVVIPNDRENTAGNAGFIGPLSDQPRTYQMLIDDSQLTSVVGQSLIGLTFRLRATASLSFPENDASFASFDIRLSEGVEPANRSLTFADNVVGSQMLVRSGPLDLPANEFPAGSSPQPFGRDISFGTPYHYTGGNLLIELRHTGLVGGSSSLDALSTLMAPYGTGVSALWQNNYTATTGMPANFVVTLINAVPEPGTCSLGLGAISFLASRRRR